MLLAVFLVTTQSHDRAFEAALDKLKATDCVSFTFVDTLVSGTSAKWTVKAQRPNLLFADSDAQQVVADGKTIYIYDKRANSFSKQAETGGALALALGRPQLLPAKLFLDPSGDWIQSARPAAGRTRNGTRLVATTIQVSQALSVTFYFEATSHVLNLATSEDTGGGSPEVHILDQFKVESTALSTDDFKFVPAEGAKDTAEASSGQSKTEEDIAQGGIPYRQLTWGDFPILERSPDGLKAHTAAYLRWNYGVRTIRSGNGFVAELTSVEIRSGFDAPRSWRLQDLDQATLDRLLPHEQGHLDINEVQAKKLRAMKLEDWPKGEGATPNLAGADLGKKLHTVFDAALAASAQQNLQYDADTRHGVDIAAQARWKQQLASELGS